MEETIPVENVDPWRTRVDLPKTSEAWKSDKIDKLATALSKAQSEIKGAEKKSVNPFFNSGYADLHTVIESSFPHLTKYGLSVIQGNDSNPGEFFVTTMLLHESGQWIRSKLKMPVEKITAQSIGSTITYGRRYGLSAITGIAQYDDDGNAASQSKGITQNHAKTITTNQGV
jgi:hypothetical protein